MGLTFFNNFFSKKKILITGCTGFKGIWLTYWLNDLGAKTYGIALKNKKKDKEFKKINTSTKLFYEDIRNFSKIKKIFNEIKPDLIFHFAAQSLVIQSQKDPQLTWETNVIGTLNILISARFVKNLKNVVISTSDKCYKIRDNSKNKIFFSENDELGGDDPYSASKAAQELVVNSFRYSFPKPKFKIVTVRAGNVIGGGDWAENRLIPDIFRSFKKNKKINIRNPGQIRPWQYILDCIQGYLLVCYKTSNSKLILNSVNIGPLKKEAYSVKKIISLVSKKIKIKSATKIKNKYKESKVLLLDSSLANKKLSFQPILNIKDTIDFTVDWYLKNIKEKKLIYDKQLSLYLIKAKENNLKWIK